MISANRRRFAGRSMILVDADILIDLFRGYPPALLWMALLGNQKITTVGFAAMQVMEGCRNLNELAQAHQRLADYDVVWPTAEAMEGALSRYGSQHLRYGLDLVDALIAETAIANHTSLLTFNIRHFAGYVELKTTQP